MCFISFHQQPRKIRSMPRENHELALHCPNFAHDTKLVNSRRKITPLLFSPTEQRPGFRGSLCLSCWWHFHKLERVVGCFFFFPWMWSKVWPLDKENITVFAFGDCGSLIIARKLFYLFPAVQLEVTLPGFRFSYVWLHDFVFSSERWIGGRYAAFTPLS